MFNYGLDTSSNALSQKYHLKFWLQVMSHVDYCIHPMRNRPRRMTIWCLALLHASVTLKQVMFCRLKQPSPACLPGFKDATYYLPVKRGYHTEVFWFLIDLCFNFTISITSLSFSVTCRCVVSFSLNFGISLRKPQWTVLQVSSFFLELLSSPIHVIDSTYFSS